MTDQPRSEAVFEIINLADDGRTNCASGMRSDAWKFVLVRMGCRIHLVVGPVSEFRYHANLVDSFCRRFDIPASRSKGTQKVEIYDRSVSVLGGGHIRVDADSKSARFYGQSTAYGPYNSEMVSVILRRGLLFSGYSVVVS